MSLPLPVSAVAIANHLWQSTLFSAVAAALALTFKKNHARIRFSLWLAASVKFLLPGSLLVGLGSYFARPMPGNRVPFYLAIDQVSKPFAAPIRNAGHAAAHLSMQGETLGAIWLAGMAAVLGYWWLRWRRVSAMIRRSRPLLQGREAELLRKLERAGAVSGVRRPMRLLLSQESMEPGICGILRPVLIWPDGFSEHLTDAQMRAILVHELGHVQRRDNLVASLHMLVEAIFWFHPLVWWIGARMVEERERACDEAVLELGNPPEVYAESILKACKFCVEAPLTCVSGVAGSNLKRRIARIMNPHSVQNLTLGRKLLLALMASAAVAGPIALGAFHAPQLSAQSLHGAGGISAAASAPHASFDTVSVKSSQSGGPGDQIEIQPYSFRYTNASIKKLIAFAYGIEAFQVAGIPDSLDSERYDIEATWKDTTWNEAAAEPMAGPPPPPPPPGGLSGAPKNHLHPFQLQAMVQSLLADQFHLKWTQQSQQLPIYVLEVGSSGPKLTATPTTPPPASFHGEAVTSVRTQIQSGEGNVSMQNAPAGAVASFLAMQFNRQVVDKTGLTGHYDIALQWTAGSDETASLTAAVEQQLGLKLESQEGPVEVLAVNRVEKPAEN